ncbi:hypothetical protein J2S55_002900 [Streptosporangium brasiliense]|uniref:Uncharacterized protein n=1 Tax=Streptosporangium brasiliense TaxID=47480 RepID=A0ABT9R322_9ACTN|nr:hypothetical protein [Streptosporangium brasiliense]
MNRGVIARRTRGPEPWINGSEYDGFRHADGSAQDYPLNRDPADRARALSAPFPHARRILRPGAPEGTDAPACDTVTVRRRD